MAVPKRVAERLASGLKRLAPVIQQQKARDVSEADTVTLVKDLLSEVFGYDKYAELTGEHAIRGTYCDLAIKLSDKLVELVEVKAIGIPLDDRHVRQAVDYAANQGVEWVVLTNAATWRLYHVIFGKPIDKRLIAEIDLAAMDPQREPDRELLYLFSREGFLKGAHLSLRDRQDATSRFLVAALLLNNQRVLARLRRELHRVVGVRVRPEEILQVLRSEVIKRDALEGPAAEAAMQRVRQQAGGRQRRTKASPGTEAADQAAALRPHPALAAEGTETALHNGARSRVDPGVSLVQILAAGRLTAPTRLFRRYKGQVLEATLCADGMVEHAGQRYDACSKAAAVARARVLGREANTNGWAFWQYLEASGSKRRLAEARDEFLKSGRAGSDDGPNVVAAV